MQAALAIPEYTRGKGAYQWVLNTTDRGTWQIGALSSAVPCTLVLHLQQPASWLTPGKKQQHVHAVAVNLRSVVIVPSTHTTLRADSGITFLGANQRLRSAVAKLQRGKSRARAKSYERCTCHSLLA